MPRSPVVSLGLLRHLVPFRCDLAVSLFSSKIPSRFGRTVRFVGFLAIFFGFGHRPN